MIDWNDTATLSKAIEKTGMRVGAFSDLAGVSRSQMYRLLAGAFQPRFGTQQRIEQTLETLAQSTDRAKAA